MTLKRLFYISDNKSKYSTKSISNYPKKLLLKAFETSIMDKNYYNSLYFGFEIIASGYFKDFWVVTFSILSEYIHVLSPNLPRAFIDRYNRYKELEKKIKKKKVSPLELRNILEIQKHVCFVIKNLIETKKKHTSFFIKPVYNHQGKALVRDIKQILPLFKRFKLLIHTVINNKLTHKGNTENTLHEIFNLFGRLLAIDSENIGTLALPYRINLYHHVRSQINKDIVGIYWNILIKASKINKNIWTQITALYEIYNLNLLNKNEKESYILLHSLYFFIYNISDEAMVSINKQDMMFIPRFYQSIQKALDTGKERVDFMKLEDRNKKQSKRKSKKSLSVNKINQKIIKSNSKKISNSNIKSMYTVKPTIPIKNLIEENRKSVAKPINPMELVNNVNLGREENEIKEVKEDFAEYEDDLIYKSLIEEHEELEPKKKQIDIVINGEGNPEDELLDFMFDFENAPTKEESDSNKLIRCEDLNPERRKVNIPSHLNPRKSMRNPIGIINKI